jgi:hypothetical protein
MNELAMKFRWVAIVLAAAAWGGCSRDVQVALDSKDLTGAKPSVEVHMIGVRNAGEYRRLHDMSMTDYWANVKTDANVYVMKFGEGLPSPQVLKQSDPIWANQWKDAKMLFILSSYPPGKDMAGDSDGRRLILPLNWSKCWSGSGPIPIDIKATGLVCQKPYKPWNPFE